MGFKNLISYAGKRVVVTGAASGMGQATVGYLGELGADIVGLDINPVDESAAKYVRTDLGDRASIDAALDQIDGRVDALFNVAGLAGGRGIETKTMLVNFVGHRHLTERLLPQMPRGGAIVNVTSLAGVLYVQMSETLMPLLHTASFEDAAAWLDANEDTFNGYGTSKEALNLWTAWKAKEYADTYGVRINAVGPGTTDTPLLDAFKANAVERTGSEDVVVASRGFLGRFAHAEDQASACVFMNSDAASMITGQVLYVDGGMAGAMCGGVLPFPAPRGR